MNLDLLRPLVGWPLMLLAAWLAGEWVSKHWKLPRVCAYAVVGLLFGSTGLSQSVGPPGALGFLAQVALGLTLFELGYRINPPWFRHNPWVLAAALLQSGLTFAAVFWVATGFGVPLDQRLVLASLCVASSPAAIMRVTHELRSAGQVTERLLHLCALDCLVAVLVFKLVVGYWHIETSGNLAKAAFESLYVICLSMLAGALVGYVAPLLNRLATSGESTTVTFAFLTVLLTGAAESLHLSPLLAALAFGVVTRGRRIMLSHAQRNFGALGDVLTVFLFVFIGSLLSWNGFWNGLVIGGAVLLGRSAVHVLVNLAIARASGTTWRKGALTGVALMPMAAFALLLLEESRLTGFDLARDSLPVIAGLLVLIDVLGPLATQRALMLAGESHPEEH
ncbi:MAG: cation:proton antiporter [Pseudomonadota bacterium]|nr:cation:proton antiporter [Pseudomonadota bacterium]